MRLVLEAVPSRRARDIDWIASRSGQSEFVVERMLQPLLANGLIESSPDGYRLTDLGRQPVRRRAALTPVAGVANRGRVTSGNAASSEADTDPAWEAALEAFETHLRAERGRSPATVRAVPG